MNNILMYLLISSMLVSMIILMISILFVEDYSNEMSESAFECGFEPFFMARVPFSINFFSITIVFLIFDLEIIILMPILFKIYSVPNMLGVTLIVWMLLIGLIIEWYDNSLSWQF